MKLLKSFLLSVGIIVGFLAITAGITVLFFDFPLIALGLLLLLAFAAIWIVIHETFFD